MSTSADIASGVVQRASDMPTSTLLRIMDDDIRSDIREEIVSSFPDTYKTEMMIRLYNIGQLTAEQGVAGNVATGDYRYKVSYLTANYETMAGEASDVVVLDTASQVDITGVPTGGDDVLSRKVYRQKNGSGDFLLMGTIADATTTTYTDNTATAGTQKSQAGWVLPFDFYDILNLKDKERQHVEDQSVRIAKNSGKTRKLAWIDYTNKAGAVTVIANNGSDKARFTSTGHGLNTGEQVSLSGFTDISYNADGTVTRISENTFDVETITFVATGTGVWEAAAKVLAFNPDHSWSDGHELTLQYELDIPNTTESGQLPYPMALHSRLMPIFRLGSAFFYLAGKPGNQDSDQVSILQERYTNAKANVFHGSISQY